MLLLFFFNISKHQVDILKSMLLFILGLLSMSEYMSFALRIFCLICMLSPEYLTLNIILKYILNILTLNFLVSQQSLWCLFYMMKKNKNIKTSMIMVNKNMLTMNHIQIIF